MHKEIQHGHWLTEIVKTDSVSRYKFKVHTSSGISPFDMVTMTYSYNAAIKAAGEHIEQARNLDNGRN